MAKVANNAIYVLTKCVAVWLSAILNKGDGHELEGNL